MIEGDGHTVGDEEVREDETRVESQVDDGVGNVGMSKGKPSVPTASGAGRSSVSCTVLLLGAHATEHGDLAHRHAVWNTAADVALN